MKGGEGAEIDLLLRPGEAHLDQRNFSEVLRLQSREYAAIEALLHQHRAFSGDD